MSEKLQFLTAVARYDLLHGAPKAQPGLKHSLGIEEEPLTYSAVLRCARRRFGEGGLLEANLILALPGFCLLLAADILLYPVGGWVKTAWSVGCAAYCLLKFEVFRRLSTGNILKLLFILLSLCGFSFWSLTDIFLAILENMAFQ